MPPTNLSLAGQVDAACDRFEAAWRAGQKPRIEDYLADVAPADRTAILRALLGIEIELRRADGDQVAAGPYRDRFATDAAAVELVLAEARLGRPGGDSSGSDPSVRTGSYHSPASNTPPAQEPTIPARIGRFPVVGLAGENSFGRVYRATDPQLGRDVAIQVASPLALDSAAARERFLNEARAVSGLNHPNICPVYEVSEENGRPYVVMGCVPGQSLEANLKARKQPLPAKQVALIVRKLALAMDAAHKKGIIHPDLRLANIRLDRDRRDVVITDFFGTDREGYAASDPATNVADLGRILQAMLRHGANGPSATDPHLETICRLAMGEGTAARFTSMRELSDALAEYLAGTAEPERQPVPMATPVPTPGPVVTPSPIVEPAPFEEMVSAFAKDARAETEAAVEEAVRRVRIPTWGWVVGLFVIAILVGIPTVLLVTRPATVTVRIPITDRELADRSLSFFLDDRPILADALAAPVELKEGEHKLVVKRGDTVVRTMIFLVRKDGGGTVEVKQDTGPVPDDSGPRRGRPKGGPDSNPGAVQRQVALHILRRGGNVRVTNLGAAPPRTPEEYLPLTPIAAADQLPATFQIVAAGFPARRGTDEDLAILARIDTIVDLWLVDSPITDKGLKELRGQKDMLALQLDGTQVTDAGLKHLAGMSHFQALYVARNNVSGTGLADLRDLPLERLIVGPAVTDAGLETIGEIASLRELSAAGPGLTDHGVAHLVKLERVESLAIGAPQLTDDALREIGRLKKLAGLGLNGAAISDDGLRHLAGLKALRRLSLDGTQVTDKGLGALEPLESVYELALINCGVTNAGARRLLGMKNLKSLALVNSLVSDPAVADLRQMIWLESLNLEGSRVTRSALRDLRRALPRTNVIPDFRAPSDLALDQVIDLGGTVLVNDQKQPVGKLSDIPVVPVTLRGVTLDGKTLTAAHLERIAAANTLEGLTLNKARLSDDAWSQLRKLTALQRLELAETGLTNSRMKMLTDLTGLTTLNLAGNPIDDAGLNFLARLKGLTSLDLTATRVTDSGVHTLQKAIPGCRIKR